MWKSLRIAALLALAAVGALKLAQYVAVRGQLDRVAQSLAPAMRLRYSDFGSGLDGRVVLENPRLEVLSGPARGTTLRAESATIQSNGTFWLLRRLLGGETGVPAALNVQLVGTSLAQETLERFAGEGWFGASSGVPFESVGCEPVSAFSARDYTRMGLALRPREDDIRYVYDAAAHTLRADIVSTAAPFSTITAHLDVSSFAPSAWLGDAPAAKAQRIEQFSLTYLDGGYLAQRNRFCAQLTGTDAAGYATRHLAAVKAFLDVRGVTLGDEVASLYRKLVVDGGSAELSSLPEAAFVPADFATYAPENLLRQLNVTMRRNTAPPILLRLAFAEPSANPPDVSALEQAAANEAEPASDIAAAPATETAPVAENAPASSIEASPPKRDVLPLLSSANAAVIDVPSAAPVALAPVSLTAATSGILAVATPPAQESAWTVVDHPSIDPRNALEAVPASAPLPPANSTAALVWRAPTIERLPEKITGPTDYLSVPPSALGAYIGAYVQLMTVGGKRVDGRVLQLEGSDIVVSIARDGGTAQVRIPTAGIRDVRLRRTALR